MGDERKRTWPNGIRMIPCSPEISAEIMAILPNASPTKNLVGTSVPPQL